MYNGFNIYLGCMHRRFETVVAAIVQQLDTSGMCGRKQAMSVLEHTDDARYMDQKLIHLIIRDISLQVFFSHFRAASPQILLHS